MRRAIWAWAAAAAVVCGGAARPAFSQGADLQELLSGKTVPLTIKLKEMDGQWRRLSIGGQAEEGGGGGLMAMFGMMFSGPAGNAYFTRGRTVTLGSETYLVAYRLPSRSADLAKMMQAGPGAKPPAPPKLTGDSELGLALVNLRAVTSLTDIRPFDLQREIKESEEAGKALEALGEGAPAAAGAAPAEDGASALVGKPAPALKLKDLAGKERTLAEFRGKPVLLNFFASWCGPCNTEAPHLEKDYWQKYRAQGLVVLGVDTGEDGDYAAKARGFQKQHKLTYPILVDEGDAVAGAFSVSAFPTNFLIDRQGNVVYAGIGFDPEALDPEVKKLMGAQAGAQAPTPRPAAKPARR